MTSPEGAGETPLFHVPYTIQLPTRMMTIAPDELNRFARLYLRDRDVLPRISKLLIVDLYVYNHVYEVNPGVVTDEIDALEGKFTRPRGTKPATQFTKEPLSGLWHKHFFSAHFLIRNVQTGLARGRLNALLRETMEALKGDTGSGGHDPELADRVSAQLARQAVEGTLDERRAASALTGEWIVFAQQEGLNYYLCLNTHRAGDQVIYDRIMAHCGVEFPFLGNRQRSIADGT